VQPAPAGSVESGLPALCGRLDEQLSRDLAGIRWPLAGSAVLEPEHVGMLELEALGVVASDHLHRAWRRRLVASAQLHPSVGDCAQIADEVAGRALRLATGPGRGELREAREAHQTLGRLRLGGEEPLAP
jgi:hypothetical protein